MLHTPAPAPTTRPAPGVRTLKLLRKLHLYFGLFIAPALLFFAFTGALQTLSLHEAAGTSYKPPAWAARLAQLHKDQNVTPRPPRSPGPAASPVTHARSASTPPPAAAPQRPPETLGSKERKHLPEKIFFLCVALGLLTSVLTGIYMAYKYERNRVLVTGLLVAGIAVPLLLLPF